MIKTLILQGHIWLFLKLLLKFIVSKNIRALNPFMRNIEERLNIFKHFPVWTLQDF